MAPKDHLPITEIKDRATFLAALSDRAREYGYKELAEKSGVPYTHMYRIFSEDGNPSIDTLTKIILALGYVIKLEKK